MLPLVARVRCYSEPVAPQSRTGWRRTPTWRSISLGARVLVLDTETTTDFTQRFLFGSFRVYIYSEGAYGLLKGADGLILGDSLSDTQRAIVEQYAEEQDLPLYSREAFVRDVFLNEVHGLGTLCVGFNLPFDLSRLAVRATYCRKRGWTDGFTLYLIDSKWLPPLHIKLLDSKRAFIELGAPAEQVLSRRDRSSKGKSRKRRRRSYPGRFLDLKTLLFALTGEGHTLESGCAAVGVPYKKREVQHGVVSPENLVYNREDLNATWQLFLGAAKEWNRHPFTPLPAGEAPPDSPLEALSDLDPETFVATHAYSPASIGKAYLRAMGVSPRLLQQPDFPKDVLGYAMIAYYGGRSECHIRRRIVPVIYLDVLSMYPTVCTLMHFWALVIADRVKVIEATKEAQAFLDRVSTTDLYKPETWRELLVLVELHPDNDILPVRAQYEESGDYQIGVNVATARNGLHLWYMLPDLVASKLLTGRAPRIRRALRFQGVGIQSHLRPIRVLGDVAVDPARQDFFRILIEKRHEFQEAQRMAETAGDKGRAQYLNSAQLGLKIIANATSYGIFAEIDDKVTGATKADVYGLRHFTSDITTEEHPGPFTFSPLAALITSGARLMLALAEVELVARGTTYALCDTDSLAIVGDRTVVTAVREQFAALTPYVFGGDLLKMEDENVPAPEAVGDSELYCHSISAKRYVLFNVADDQSIIVRRPSEHGLGHLLSPFADKGGKEWMAELWKAVILWARGTVKHGEGLPFADLPALGRFPIARPSILSRFIAFNKRLDPKTKKRVPVPYDEQVKPFNFMLVVYPDTGDISTGGEAYWDSAAKVRNVQQDRQPIRPIAPYEPDPRKWRRLQWVDLHTGRPVSLDWTREPTYLATSRVRVQTYRDVARRHLTHPESKAAGPDGQPCGPATIGELQRLHVHVTHAAHVGKESQKLEEVQALLASPAPTVAQYPDEEAEWGHTCAILKKIPLAILCKGSGLSRATIKRARNLRRRPHPKHCRILAEIAERWERDNPG